MTGAPRTFGSTRSMTGFASLRAEAGAFSWVWEIRSVNGRGLDLRLRLPDWIEGLEQSVRQALQKEIARGNVSVSLKVTRTEEPGTTAVDEAALAGALDALSRIDLVAQSVGLSLAPLRATDIAAMPGVLNASTAEDDTVALRARLMDDVPKLIAAFQTARAEEGAALSTIIAEQLAEVERLTREAATAAGERDAARADTLRQNVDRLLAETDAVDEARLAQELALLAVKADVTEELDRLAAHIDAARALLDAAEAKGRKFDFLMQEFNREANTLCSKAGSKALTAIGLDLKTVIDQMREQVQNVE